MDRITAKDMERELADAVERGLDGPVALEHRSSVYGKYTWRLVEMPNGPHSYISTGRFGDSFSTAREMYQTLRSLAR